MKRSILFVSVLFFAALPLLASAADDAGKKLFTDNKCQTCHSIQSAGITSTMGDKSPAAKAGKGDLSDVGSAHDAAWIAKYITKKETSKDGKSHPKEFTGSEADLKTLSDWLASLKKK